MQPRVVARAPKYMIRLSMGFTNYWGRQFGNPTGLGGKVATFIMNRMNQPMYKTILRETKNNTNVLDVGFGNGYLLKKLLKKSNSTFYGIDISQDMVKTAKQKNRKFVSSARLHLTKATVENMPFDISFGQIYTINTVYFWNDLGASLNEIYNKLESGGEFFNVCYTKAYLDKLGYTKDFKKYTEQELLTATQLAGFTAEVIPIKQGKSFYVQAVKA
jgi:ubiquinone/menaquinone biosynthesis C-methylase UbiE